MPVPTLRPSREGPRRTRVVLALALAGALAPAAWTGHLLLSYALVPAACADGGSARLHMLTVAGLVVGGAAVWWALRVRRRVAERDGTAVVLSQVVVALSAYFTLVVAAVGLVGLFQDPCT